MTIQEIQMRMEYHRAEAEAMSGGEYPPEAVEYHRREYLRWANKLDKMFQKLLSVIE